MSTLTLVRHGQAAPFQQTDAALTVTGEAQAAKLAEFWLRHGVQFDEVHCGGAGASGAYRAGGSGMLSHVGPAVA